MSVRTIVEGDQQITVQVLRRTDVLGNDYWQGRAMFQLAGGRARGDVVTTMRHATAEAAERAAIALARASGWGTR
ncbi:hypothetical protein [Pseudoxanthomonas sp. PXM02]|jgi:hypothetical protein|uniref:hypothetical protein n=1 Tax=Pseudoxanthomonas sp. PXM02 TaxID=2769294 RepID=UPI001783D2DE|nr:hypothetical protein [Pseudoxanthomonas sp. PXM02]MBD9478839.1 hypothetical protein [Pseudoxanthomonas sp. PXM02]